MRAWPPRRSDEPGARRALSGARTLREAAGVLLDAQVKSSADPAGAAELVRRSWLRASARATLAPGLPLTLTISPRRTAELVHVLALRTGDFLANADLTAVRRCDGEGCGWFFLDATRNRSRRWCDSADCGNRVRVARHRARRAGTNVTEV